VNDRHLARLNDLLADARRKGATVIPCADYDAGRNGRRMPLHIVTGCTADMRIMQEELFGPILAGGALRYHGRGDPAHQCRRTAAGAVLLQP